MYIYVLYYINVNYFYNFLFNFRNLSNAFCSIENHFKNIFFLVEDKTKCPLLSGMIIDIALLVTETKQMSVLKSIGNRYKIISLSQGYEVNVIF